MKWYCITCNQYYCVKSVINLGIKKKLNSSIFLFPGECTCMVYDGHPAWKLVCPLGYSSMLYCRDVCCGLEYIWCTWRSQGKYTVFIYFFNLLDLTSQAPKIGSGAYICYLFRKRFMNMRILNECQKLSIGNLTWLCTYNKNSA